MNEFAQDWVKRAVAEIFAAETRKYYREVANFVIKNNKLTGVSTPGFNFLGENYFVEGEHWRKHFPSLSAQLIPAMTKLHTYWKQVQLDKTIISQILYKLVAPCVTIQEVRDALPECVVAFIPELAAMPRTQPAAWTIKDYERDMRQYKKILPKIETYCAVRYIY